MSNDRNLDLARQYFEHLWNRGDLTAVPRLCAEEVTGHVNGATIHGHETLRQRVAALHAVYAAPTFAIDDLIADRDRVLARWSFRAVQTGPAHGRPATGRAITITGMNLFRISAGRIAELWVNADDLGELEQLGVVQLPPA